LFERPVLGLVEAGRNRNRVPWLDNLAG